MSRTVMQLDLFKVETLPDGRVMLTPRLYVQKDDISVAEARRLLNGISRDDIYTLIGAGSIRAWRKEGDRTKYRIDPESVLAYKARQTAMCRR